MNARLLPTRAFILCVLASTASAQVSFVSVGNDLGLVHSVPYGPTFDFLDTSWPRDRTAILAMMQKNMGNGAAVGDYDGDGDYDLYLLGQEGQPNKLFRNDVVNGSRRYTDVSVALGVADLGLGRLAHFADFDNDGLQDLLLINDDTTAEPHPPCRLYRNDGSTFVDVTPGSGFAPFGYLKGGACLGDYDNDGRLDVYVGFWFMETGGNNPIFPGYNRLYRNLGDFHFQDVTLDVGLGEFSRDSFTCIFADFDNDRDPDLYVAVDHTSDVYYRNDGGFFVDRTIAVGATHTGNDMGVAVADLGNDGDLDLFNTNITDNNLNDGRVGTTQYNTMQINQLTETGVLSFVDEAGPRGVRDAYWGWGAEFLDVENDGDLDLYAVNGYDQFLEIFSPGLVDTPEVLFLNDGTDHFARSAGTGADFVGDARAAVAFDYDLDGDQDLLVTNLLGTTILLENRTPNQGHWLDVLLVGGCDVNRNAVGARVHATVGDTTYTHEVIAGGSYLSGRPHEQHFGLGDAAVVDELRVAWPDGTETLRRDVAADQRIVMRRAAGDADGDHRVDLSDFAAFQRCFGEHGIPPPKARARLDLDADGDLDIDDYTRVSFCP